ncbi:MAG: GNAT family N-acetyltransferase [Bacteroidales bacterium]|nr:GNAT family N-acetyltransferase [Bacteroidales bacterium]
MRPIIDAVDRTLLLSELTPDKLIRKTNNADNELYVFTAHNAPNLMREIGRVRELTFREAGGGTGEELDIDYFDTNKNCYKQLIVWDPSAMEILGGYRYIECKNAHDISNAKYNLATSHLYEFSEKFENDFLPYTIELGRSFVQPMYQTTKNARKALYALDNLWDGLGFLIVNNPEIKYFFGKVTMYNCYNRTARQILLSFIYLYFPDSFNLMQPKKPSFKFDAHQSLKNYFKGNDYDGDYKVLQGLLKAYGESIPPLINSYMKISPSMMTLGTSLNDTFGDVEETAILISIEDIYQQKKERHLIF